MYCIEGVGKSSIIEVIKQRCPLKLLVTATTGMAANAIGGETINRVAGIRDGRFMPQEYVAAILEMPLYLERLRRGT